MVRGDYTPAAVLIGRVEQLVVIVWGRHIPLGIDLELLIDFPFTTQE